MPSAECGRRSVVVDAPVLDEHLRLGERREELPESSSSRIREPKDST